MEENKVTAVETEEAKETVTGAETEKAEETVTGAEMEEVKTNMEVLLQYRHYEVNIDTVTERVKEHYRAKGYKEPIENMQVYVKPEDFTAYYVINDGVVVGKVNLF